MGNFISWKKLFAGNNLKSEGIHMLVSTVVEFMIKTGKTFIHQNSWQP